MATWMHPKDSPRWMLSFVRERRPRSLTVLILLRWVMFRWCWNSPVDNLYGVHFVSSTRWTVVLIAHPSGGSVRRLRCDNCGAETSYPNNDRLIPCATCAVERENRIKVWWKPKPVRDWSGTLLFHRSWEWPHPKPPQRREVV